MGYTAQELAAIKRKAERFAADDTCGGRFCKDGRLTLRVPTEAYRAAVDANGGVSKDGKTCWHDEEWVKDMRRLHPEIDRCPDEIRPAGLRNRFGRVKERIVYPRRSQP